MIATIRRALASTAAAVCFAASFAANAAGVFYQSDFDPVDFIVKAIFNVDYLSGSQCRASDGFVFANALDGLNSPGRQCDVSLYSAVGTLTDGSETAYLPFVTPANPLTNLILGAYIQGGELAGILWDPTVLLGPLTTSDYSNNDLNGTWKLSFISSDLTGPPFDSTAVLWEQEQHRRCVTTIFGRYCWTETEWEPEYTAELIYQRNPVGYRPLGDVPPEIALDGEAILRSNDVPEPGSLALLGGALVAGWFSRRRKSV